MQFGSVKTILYICTMETYNFKKDVVRAIAGLLAIIGTFVALYLIF